MKLKFTLVILLFYCLLGRSQEGPVDQILVSGKIIDKTSQQPLEYATIVMVNLRSKQVSGGITNIKGEFSFTVAIGLYNIAVEYISYQTHKIDSKKIMSNTDLGTIALALDTQSLEEVVVVAEKTTMEIRLDKKIYNVGKDLTVTGGTVSDVLDNVPSVAVDIEGNVSLRGNDNVRILINGKPSGLVGLNSTDALRQLPAEAIEKVEVITSPSARYDAEGTAGILNIILRRSKLAGLNGAITTNVGYPNAAGVSGNVNYRMGDFNFFTTSGYSYRESPGDSYTATNFTNNNLFFEETRDFDRVRNGLNTNVGIEWYINNTATITSAILFRNSDNQRNTTNQILQRDATGVARKTNRFDPEAEDDKVVQYTLNFDKRFKKEGAKLTADFQFEDTREDENSLISQDGVAQESVITLEGQQRILLQTDYVLPIKENSQVELGYRGNFNTLAYDYEVNNINDGIPVLNTELSNVLQYKEHINAWYTQFGSKIDKVSLLLGLRVENARINIDQRTTAQYNLKTYTNFFPTLNLGLEISDRQSITLGYNRRIRRPRAWNINPFPSRSSATNLYQGNPDLDPSLSNALDLGYLNRLGKLTLNSSVYFQRATAIFSRITEDTGQTTIVNGEEVAVIRTTTINLASENRYGLEFNLIYSPTRKWRLNGNFNFFKSEVKGTYQGNSLDAANTSWQIRVNNKISLPGKIDWQTRLSYRGPRINAQNKRKGVFVSDMAFSKDLFKERASLTFNISDLFNSGKNITETNVPGFFLRRSEFRFRQRSFRLAFTYRFKQKKNNARKRGDFNGGFEEGGEF